MNRELPRLIVWILRVFRTPDAVLGDLAEEYDSGARSREWLWRQTLSAMKPWNVFSSMGSDVVYAVRGLRHNPGFAAVAILAVALGIGVNTGIFSILNGIALRPLPAGEPSELVSIYQNERGARRRVSRGSSSMFSLSEYEGYRDNNQTLADVMAYSNTPPWTVTLGGSSPREITGEIVSCNYFDVLRRQLVLGPGFTDADCAAGAAPSVVLSHDLWTNAFASDPSILGARVLLNRHVFIVAGIAPPGFHGTEPLRSMFWVPIEAEPVLSPENNLLTDDQLHWLNLVGRKKAAVSTDQVRADLAVIAARIDQSEPGRTTSLIVSRATSLAEPQIRRALLAGSTVILVAFGLVLLIACANVANLLLARATGRKKEIAVRLSLGASRGRLIQQLLTESLLIALAGGALGSLLAVWSFQGITAFVLSHLPNVIPSLAIEPGPDLRVFVFALSLTLATGIFFGLLPAIQASRPDLNVALKEDSAGSGRLSGGFLRSALVGMQVAVCMVLLISAGLLLRGLYAAQTVDPGFDYKDISVVTFDLRGQGYDDTQGAAFQARVFEQIGSIPGVDGIARANVTPLSPGGYNTVFSLPGEQQFHPVQFDPVSPEYFAVLGIPIVRGRTFTAEDAKNSPGAVIVTESMARQFWPGEDPIGKILKMRSDRNHDGEVEIVGVAKDVQVSRVGETNTVYIYTAANPEQQRNAQVLLRSKLDFATVAAAVRTVMRRLDPNLVVNVNRLEDNLDFWRSLSRLAAGLSGSLGALALLLASIGVYGVVSYGVSRRLRELGIRMVLGANAREVLSMVLRQAMRPVLAGAVVGVALSAAASQILSSILFGVSTLDPIAFVLSAGFLLTVALAASLAPALRATRVDPMNTLRYE